MFYNSERISEKSDVTEKYLNAVNDNDRLIDISVFDTLLSLTNKVIVKFQENNLSIEKIQNVLNDLETELQSNNETVIETFKKILLPTMTMTK
jgi:hypothetical protein